MFTMKFKSKHLTRNIFVLALLTIAALHIGETSNVYAQSKSYGVSQRALDSTPSKFLEINNRPSDTANYKSAYLNCHQIRLDLGVHRHIPKHIQGDKDFHGHGPRYEVQMSPLLYRNSQDLPLLYHDTLAIRIDMRAWEVDKHNRSKHDTAVDGVYYKEMYRAPRGWYIRQIVLYHPEGVMIVPSILFNHDYNLYFVQTDRNGHRSYFKKNPNIAIAWYSIVGDTSGNEAGTRTGITVEFNDVSVIVCPRNNSGS